MKKAMVKQTGLVNKKSAEQQELKLFEMECCEYYRLTPGELMGDEKLSIHDIRLLGAMDFVWYSIGNGKPVPHNLAHLAAHNRQDKARTLRDIVRLTLRGYVRIALHDRRRGVLIVQRSMKGLRAVIAARAPAKCEWPTGEVKYRAALADRQPVLFFSRVTVKGPTGETDEDRRLT